MSRPSTVLRASTLACQAQLPEAGLEALLAASARSGSARGATELTATVVASPSASPALISRFVDDRRVTVRAAAAAASSVPAELEKLADDQALKVRRAVAGNRAAGPDVLAGLLDDPDGPVRTAALGNRSCPQQDAADYVATLSGLDLAVLPQVQHRERRFVTFAQFAHVPGVAPRLARVDPDATRAALLYPGELTGDRELVDTLVRARSDVISAAVATDPVFDVDAADVPPRWREVADQVEQWRDGRSLVDAAAGSTPQQRRTAAGWASDAVDRALAATVGACDPSEVVAEVDAMVERSRNGQASWHFQRDRSADLAVPPSAWVLGVYADAAFAAGAGPWRGVFDLLHSPRVGRDRYTAVCDVSRVAAYRSDAVYDPLIATFGSDRDAWTLALGLLGSWAGSADELARTVVGLT